MINKQSLFDAFGNLFSKIYGNEKYKFSPSKTDVKIADSFLCSFKGGESALFEYTTSAFRYYSSLSLEFGIKKIMFNWVYGKKFLCKFSEIQSGGDYSKEVYFNQLFRSEHGITSPVVKTVSYSVVNINEVEETKKESFDPCRRLVSCLLNTTLFNPKSFTCVACGFSADCKLLLRHKYPEIATLRKLNN